MENPKERKKKINKTQTKEEKKMKRVLNAGSSAAVTDAVKESLGEGTQCSEEAGAPVWEKQTFQMHKHGEV